MAATKSAEATPATVEATTTMLVSMVDGVTMTRAKVEVDLGWVCLLVGRCWVDFSHKTGHVELGQI
jgi:hypothetical protein